MSYERRARNARQREMWQQTFPTMMTLLMQPALGGRYRLTKRCLDEVAGAFLDATRSTEFRRKVRIVGEVICDGALPRTEQFELLVKSTASGVSLGVMERKERRPIFKLILPVNDDLTGLSG